MPFSSRALDKLCTADLYGLQVTNIHVKFVSGPLGLGSDRFGIVDFGLRPVPVSRYIQPIHNTVYRARPIERGWQQVRSHEDQSLLDFFGRAYNEQLAFPLEACLPQPRELGPPPES